MLSFLTGVREGTSSIVVEQFRVLAAALRLKEFTTGRLAAESSVETSVVGAMILDRADLFSHREPVGLAAGEAVWGIAEERAALELQELVDALPLSDADDFPALGLRVAASSLRQVLPAAAHRERCHLLAAAEVQLAAAREADAGEAGRLETLRGDLSTLVYAQAWLVGADGGARPSAGKLWSAIEAVLGRGPTRDVRTAASAMPALVAAVLRESGSRPPAVIDRLEAATRALAAQAGAEQAVPSAPAAEAVSSVIRTAAMGELEVSPGRYRAELTVKRVRKAGYFVGRRRGERTVRVARVIDQLPSVTLLNSSLIRVHLASATIAIVPRERDPLGYLARIPVISDTITAFDIDLKKRLVVGAAVSSAKSPPTLVHYDALAVSAGSFTYRDRLVSSGVWNDAPVIGPQVGHASTEKSGSGFWTAAEHIQIRLDPPHAIPVLDTLGGSGLLAFEPTRIGEVWSFDFAASSGQLVSAQVQNDGAAFIELVPFDKLDYDPGRGCFVINALPGAWIVPRAGRSNANQTGEGWF